MSGRTARLRAFIERLPAILRPVPQPRLIDAVEEMERAYQVSHVLRGLEHTSKLRVLKHCWAIEQDNAQRIAEFDGAEAPLPARIDDSQCA